jgi:hypothetical protein
LTGYDSEGEGQLLPEPPNVPLSALSHVEEGGEA